MSKRLIPSSGDGARFGPGLRPQDEGARPEVYGIVNRRKKYFVEGIQTYSAGSVPDISICQPMKKKLPTCKS